MEPTLQPQQAVNSCGEIIDLSFEIMSHLGICHVAFIPDSTLVVWVRYSIAHYTRSQTAKNGPSNRYKQRDWDPHSLVQVIPIVSARQDLNQGQDRVSEIGKVVRISVRQPNCKNQYMSRRQSTDN